MENLKLIIKDDVELEKIFKDFEEKLNALKNLEDNKVVNQNKRINFKNINDVKKINFNYEIQIVSKDFEQEIVKISLNDVEIDKVNEELKKELTREIEKLEKSKLLLYNDEKTKQIEEK